MPIELRDYQIPLAERLPIIVRGGKRRILVQMSTGAGKTYFAAHFVERAVAKGARVYFLVHRRELIKQTVLALSRAGVQCGIVAAGFAPNPLHQVQVCSIPSMARRVHALPIPNLVIADEIHHAPASSWSKLLHHFSGNGAVIIGLSATPWRMSGEGLGQWFDEMICGPTTAELIQMGWLSKYRLFAPGHLKMDGVRTTAGDYNKADLDERMRGSSVVGDALSHYLKYVPGKQALLFAWSVESSIDIAKQFNDAGIPAAHIDGTTDDRVRDRAIERFTSGDIKVLTNVNIAIEGLDISGIEALFLLRPTQSLTLYLQAIGRALRPHPGKAECWIFDHALNVKRHGLPDSEREWTLEGQAVKRRKRPKDDDESAGVRVCPACNETWPMSVRECRCGQSLIQSREVEEHDGELAEVDVEQLRRDRMREQGQAKDLESLIAFGRKKGYKNPAAWAHFILKARQEKQNRRKTEALETARTSPPEQEEAWLF